MISKHSLLFLLFTVLTAACTLPEPAAITPTTPDAPTRTENGLQPDTPPATGLPLGMPTLIFHNGTLLTMDPDRPGAQAIAIQKDTILAVGSDDEILALAVESTRIIDLGGATMMPGFNDAHSHLLTDSFAGFPDQNAAFAEALRLGYTSISELFTDQGRLDNFIARAELGDLPLRVNVYLPLNYAFDRFGDWYRAYIPGHEYSPFLRIAGVKLYVDNGEYGKKFLSAPYSDNPGYYGEVYWSQDELNAIVQEAHQAGYQIAAHTMGDAAHDLILNAYEKALDGEGNEAYHHRIEHVMILRHDQLERMRAMGIIASVQLSFFHADWRDEFETTLGPDRVLWVGRWRDLLDAGVPVIGSTDAPYGYGTVRSPLKAVYQAVTREGEGEAAPANWMLSQTLRVEEALDLLTLQAAYGTFQDPVKGSLSPGKLADLVILSANPLSIEPRELLNTDVWLTLVGGQTMYCAQGQEYLCP